MQIDHESLTVAIWSMLGGWVLGIFEVVRLGRSSWRVLRTRAPSRMPWYLASAASMRHRLTRAPRSELRLTRLMSCHSVSPAASGIRGASVEDQTVAAKGSGKLPFTGSASLIILALGAVLLVSTAVVRWRTLRDTDT